MFAVLKTLSRAFAAPSRAERERAYLEDAASLYDLECRQRQIEQGLFRQGALAV